jgi:TetR/AcrR family transcriptional repressor of nem operon
MAWNPEHKQLTREKILNSAAKLFTRYGFDNISLNHRNGKVRNCPLAIMITDITQRDKQVRDSYTRVFKGFVNILHQQLDDTVGNTKEQAIQTAVMMIGGVAIARAINDDDLAKELLKVCRHSALKF